MKKTTLLIATTLMVFTLAVAMTLAAFAHTGHVITPRWAGVTPTIDGVISPGEWDDAYTLTMVGGLVTAHVKNDATKLYMVAYGPHLEETPSLVAFFFDNGNNLDLTDGGDMKALDTNGVSSVIDRHWVEGVGWVDDDVVHGDCVYRFYPAEEMGLYEGWMPLDSGDGQDLRASPGDTFGMMCAYADPIIGIWWPETTTQPNTEDPSTWGDVVLATEAEGEGCFIATAACGFDDGRVEILRNFRDIYMATDPVGSALKSAYYRLSPPIAGFIDDHPALKPAVRAALLPAVAVSEVAVGITQAQKIAIVSGLAVLSLASLAWLTKRRLSRTRS